jgi:hypothetical protein
MGVGWPNQQNFLRINPSVTAYVSWCQFPHHKFSFLNSRLLCDHHLWPFVPLFCLVVHWCEAAALHRVTHTLLSIIFTTSEEPDNDIGKL